MKFFVFEISVMHHVADFTKRLVGYLEACQQRLEGAIFAMVGAVLIFTLAVSCVAGLIFGLIPALHASKWI